MKGRCTVLHVWTIRLWKVWTKWVLRNQISSSHPILNVWVCSFSQKMANHCFFFTNDCLVKSGLPLLLIRDSINDIIKFRNQIWRPTLYLFKAKTLSTSSMSSPLSMRLSINWICIDRARVWSGFHFFCRVSYVIQLRMTCNCNMHTNWRQNQLKTYSWYHLKVWFIVMLKNRSFFRFKKLLNLCKYTHTHKNYSFGSSWKSKTKREEEPLASCSS